MTLTKQTTYFTDIAIKGMINQTTDTACMSASDLQLTS